MYLLDLYNSNVFGVFIILHCQYVNTGQQRGDLGGEGWLGLEAAGLNTPSIHQLVVLKKVPSEGS